MATTVGRRTAAIILAFLIWIQPSLAVAQSALSFRESMNVIAMVESGSNTIASLYALGYIPNNQSITISGEFSEAGFSSAMSGKVNGEDFSLAYVGTASGDFGETVTVSFSSNGLLGSRAITSAGHMNWGFDAAAGGYDSFESWERGEMNPIWIPILIGILARSLVIRLATTPLRVHENGTLKNPGAPSDEPMTASVVIDGGSGSIARRVNGGYVQANAFWSDDNRLSGTVTTIPEPETLAMFLIGLGLMGALGRRRA